MSADLTPREPLAHSCMNPEMCVTCLRNLPALVPPSVGTGSATRPDTKALRATAIACRRTFGNIGVNMADNILECVDWIDAQPDLSELRAAWVDGRAEIPVGRKCSCRSCAAKAAVIAAVDRLLATEGGE